MQPHCIKSYQHTENHTFDNLLGLKRCIFIKFERYVHNGCNGINGHQYTSFLSIKLSMPRILSAVRYSLFIWNHLTFRAPISHELVTCILTHWCRVMHICIGNLTIIGLDNGLLPDQCHVITWTIAGILLIGPLGTNFSEILIKIRTFSFTKIHLKTLSVKQRPFCLGINVLRQLVAWCIKFCNSALYCTSHG